MTPKNIVNMALLVGAEVIAVTDHNTARNARAVTEAAGDRLIVVPGLEVWSREDVHILCLFPNLAVAESFDRYVFDALPSRRCDAEVFGQQYLFDAESRIIGWEDKLLLSPTSLSVDEICHETMRLGGVVIPAHVDKTYGLAVQLGFIPEHLGIRVVEVSKRGKQPRATQSYPYVVNSDAHNLATLAGSTPWELDIALSSPLGVILALSKY
jgi:PHP family Zn ribbon phosphoesterase